MIENFEQTKTTEEEILILFPYHEQGIPLSVPIVSKVHCSPQYKIHRKKTDLYCFEYILRGTQIVVSDKKYKVSAGDFCIIHNGKHLYYSDKNDPPTKVSICVYGNFVKNLLDAYGVTQTLFSNINVLHVFDKLLSLNKDRENIDYNFFCQKTALCIHELIHCVLSSKQYSINIPNYIVNAKKILDNSLNEKLNLDDVCKKVNTSKSQLIKSFKKYYGVTPYNYLVDLKINTAKILLSNTNQSVKEIAYTLKFPDEYYFSNQFKKKVGVSPTKFANPDK